MANGRGFGRFLNPAQFASEEIVDMIKGDQGVGQTNLTKADFRNTRPSAVDKFRAQQGGDVTDQPTTFEDLKAGEGFAGSTTEPTGRGGGFTVLNKGLTPKSKIPGRGLSFGLQPGKLPTFEELGGALSNIAAFIGGQVRINRARGLVPGVEVTKQKDLGLSVKDELTSITNELDAIGVSPERRKTLRDRLDVLRKRFGVNTGDNEEVSDLAEIEKLLNAL